MDGSVMNETMGKAAIISNARHSLGHNTQLTQLTPPTSTSTCVVIKSFRAPVTKLMGTVKLKTQMDTAFPLFLRGRCTEEQFGYTIEGINWFADLLQAAEVEMYAEIYASSVAWKEVHSALVVRDARELRLEQYCIANNIQYTRRRPRVSTEDELKDCQIAILESLHKFIDDENARNYIGHGIQWNYPEKNQWKWLEIHILPDGSEVPAPPAPSLPLPIEPDYGDQLKFTIQDTLEIDGHTEYVIHITSNMKDWHPITDTYVLHRFNDFKEFYNTLNEYMEAKSVEIGMPNVPDGSFIGRKSKSTVNKRKALFQDLLDSISASKELQTCQPVLDFFNVQPDIKAWKYSHYLNLKPTSQ